MNEFSIAREMPSVYLELLKNREIVERLKKRIEELQTIDGSEINVIDELQKILGDTK